MSRAVLWTALPARPRFEALCGHGRVAPVILYQRTEYAASMIDGRTVTETAPSGRSAQEIIELWQAVYAQIGLRVAA